MRPGSAWGAVFLGISTLASCQGPPGSLPDARPADGREEADAIPACPGGWTRCAGECRDLLVDRENCGGCGRSCLGTECEAGLCATETIAAEQGMPVFLALDDTHVYWANLEAGTVMRRAKLGGPVEPLLEGIRHPWSLAIDGDDLYAAASQIGENITHLYRLPKAGGAAVEMAAFSGIPLNIAVDGQAIYLTRGLAAGGIVRVAKDSGAFDLLTEWPYGVSSLVLGEADVFYGVFTLDEFETDHVARIPKSGGMATRLTDVERPVTIARLGDDLYVASYDQGEIVVVDSVEGGAVSLVDTEPNTADLAVDCHGVAWVNFGAVDAVSELEHAGTTPVALAPGSSAASIALDDDHVYFGVLGQEGQSNGGVFRVARFAAQPRLPCPNEGG